MCDTLKPGMEVQDIRDRSKRGTITDGPEMRGGREKVRIEWHMGASTWLPCHLVVPAASDTTVEGLLADRAFGGHEDFVRNYTHRKLLTPVDDTLYSLSASRTKVMPHQFKPLIKFLESMHRRFLIADEVGLGKTIEAGIVISELRARETLGGVLVLCPNHLRDKWRTELQRRFDEEFTVVAKRSDWLQRSAMFEREGTGHARLIVGHKTLASRRILEHAEQGVPSFDLLIIDEAHYGRNPATLLRRLLAELADAANQVLLLTATPLQTRVQNLLSLLRLLDEDAFRSADQFERRLEVNRQMVRAEIVLRRASASVEARREAAGSAIAELAGLGTWDRVFFGLAGEDGLDSVEQMLGAAQTTAEPFELVAAAADRLRELNLLSPYITRTRKVDVQETCERRVRIVRPDLTPEEVEFYRAASGWMRDVVERRYGRERVAFLTREPERRLASCFHGFWQTVSRHGLGPKVDPNPPPEHVRRAYEGLGVRDTKYDVLRETLGALGDQDPSAKAIVFASFRPTISYLSRRLAEDGFDHEVIHGQVPMDPVDAQKDERGRRVRRFTDDDQCRVLVSSNVGGEGLDLQRASVVVNYDLPWNPSVVEQRIGRVDRYGQQRPVIHVANLILPDTVEDLVFTRLIERLHLFREVVGDLAAVLGSIVRKLSTDFLTQEISPEEVERRLAAAEARGRNQLRHRMELLSRENEFIAYDQDFMDLLKALDAEGRTFRPAEIFQVCAGIITKHFKKSSLRRVADDEAASDDQICQLTADFHLREMLKRSAPRSTVVSRTLAQFREDSPVRVTFDGQTAERNPDVPLLTTRHPFVRALVRYAEGADPFHPVTALTVQDERADGRFESGLLTLFEASLIFGAEAPRRYLLPLIVLSSGEILEESESRRILRLALDRGRTMSAAGTPDGEVLRGLFRVCWRQAEEHLEGLSNRIREKEERRLRPRVAEVQARYRRRITSALERAATARRRGYLERGVRIDRYRRQLERDLDREVAKLQRLPEPEETITPVGAAWVRMA